MKRNVLARLIYKAGEPHSGAIVGLAIVERGPSDPWARYSWMKRFVFRVLGLTNPARPAGYDIFIISSFASNLIGFQANVGFQERVACAIKAATPAGLSITVRFFSHKYDPTDHYERCEVYGVVLKEKTR